MYKRSKDRGAADKAHQGAGEAILWLVNGREEFDGGTSGGNTDLVGIQEGVSCLYSGGGTGVCQRGHGPVASLRLNTINRIFSIGC
jgi:hypothetical protein